MKKIVILIAGFLLMAQYSSAALTGKEIYTAQKCAKCHGETGEGNTRSAKNLKAANKEGKIKSFTDKATFENLTDAQLEDSIRKGGTSVKLSDEMEGYSEKKISNEELKELVKYVKSMIKP